jgi:hypothetical protein
MSIERVKICLEGLEMVGNVHLQTAKNRVIDLLNDKSEQFLALTDVKIFDNRAQLVGEDPFVCVNKDRISMLRLSKE